MNKVSSAPHQYLTNAFSCCLLLLVLCTVSCPAQQTEEQALQSLREMTRDGKLPPENFVAGLESRFAGKRTGALAKLLHARIRFENNDFAGAAVILNTEVFQKKTNVGDHALWLRGQALQKAGNHAEAMKVIESLLRDFPDSIRTRDAKLAWANSAIQTGRAAEVAPFLTELSEKYDPDALLLTAKAYEAQDSQEKAEVYYRRAYFLGTGTSASTEAEAKLIATGKPLPIPPLLTKEQMIFWGDRLLAAKRYQEAAVAYVNVGSFHDEGLPPQVQARRITALVGAGKILDAVNAFEMYKIPEGTKEREEAYRQLVLGYAKAKMWPQARSMADDMRQKFPDGMLVPKTFVDAGLAARDAKNKTEETYFFSTAVSAFPNAIEVAQAQFEMAWMQHESKNLAISSTMFVDHLARYTDKDTTNRGKAGYWAARDSERAGKISEACTLYDAVTYRYAANWYGYLALDRLATLKNQGKCSASAIVDPIVAKAVANLKKVTVAAETATDKELARAQKSEELSTIGLFDWAFDELSEAKKTADKSPKINLALAKYYRMKGDQVNALLALQKSYPDYSQMFPEEMGREEWDIFYPLTNWADITKWSQARALDKYQVAGFIRQETIFDPRAKSAANAFGLMQLLLPTAKTVARSYGTTVPNSAEDLYDASLNIELGTAFLKDQFAKFGRIEYVAVAYNAGPNRVAPWRATLPAEMDEFVEAIPFRETKGYVQGIIRNTAQYRRLYDENGNFKPNVGTRPLRGEIDTKPRDQFVAENPDITVDQGE